VLNAAARLVVKKRKCDSITPTLRDDLQWLLVRQRVDFKICLLVYKCLHQLAPVYLTSLFTPVTAIATCRHLRRANAGDLAGPSVWNSLPSELKTMSLTKGHFISQLKTVMFCHNFQL